MTDTPQPTPADSWSLTDALKSYGVDDPEAARAVVALVMEEAAKVARGRPLPESPEHYTHWPEIGQGKAANDGDKVAFARAVAAALRALIPKDTPNDHNRNRNR